MMKRKLGRSGIEVSALGLGCWAIGGVFLSGGVAAGWGRVDDDESIRAIHAGLDLGVSFIDTANSYGAGHSERVVGRALKGKRDQVVLATKFGNVFDEDARRVVGSNASADSIRAECDASLKRLQTDCIDLYQFHINRYDGDAVLVREVLEELVAAGKIRWYGWSTDDPVRARIFAEGRHCATVQHRLNVFENPDKMLDLCQEMDLASINKSPLASGLLSGKFGPNTAFSPDDRRHGWDFRQGARAAELKKLDAIRDALTEGGRTLTQGALCWIWAKSDRTIPIPGFRNTSQVKENAGALAFGPLSTDGMRRIDAWLGDGSL